MTYLQPAVMVARWKIFHGDGLPLLTQLLISLIYWQWDSKLYDPQNQMGWKQEGCFPLFSLSVALLCKSLRVGQHLDSTLGQRYEPNFKRQSRDRSTPGWFHHWQDQIQVSVSNLILISWALFPVGSSQCRERGGVWVWDGEAWWQFGIKLAELVF